MTEENSFGDVEFTSTEQKEYFQEARLGIDFENFLRSDVGRFLQARAVREYESAKEGILDCNPDSFFGRRKIKKFQQQAAAADNFLNWCAEAITNGRQAEQLLEDY